MRDRLTVIVPTYNEEINLPKCLQSIDRLGARVVVADSGSTDRTVEIAREHGCDVLSGTWRTFSDKINWIIDNLPDNPAWVMRVDADETIDPTLANELRSALENERGEISAFEVDRHYYFLGKWIRYGGMSPNWSVRIWRHGRARMERRELDEHMIVNGRVLKLMKGAVLDENLKGLSDWIAKHNRYADNEVAQMLSAVAGGHRHLTGQQYRRRMLKESIYLRIPLFVRPFVYWLYRYFVLAGFLDGKAGFVYHILHGLWYRLLVDAKLYENRVMILRKL